MKLFRPNTGVGVDMAMIACTTADMHTLLAPYTALTIQDTMAMAGAGARNEER